MGKFRVGIIGCGRPRESGKATGFGMAYSHAVGYETSPDAEIVALADISRENADAFQQEHGGERIYGDYREMLAKERLDIVSICTWPGLHAEMVIASAEAGVKAIHCEKPMAPTYGQAVRMVQTCKERGVQLTFNHQRRFGAPFRKAKELLHAGAIGELIRLEASCGDLFDWGTHWFDMLFFYNDETPAVWVIGQIDPRGGRQIFGVPSEGQGISYIKYQNGVHGLLVTGFEAGWEAGNRLVGTQGVIEVGHSNDVPLRMWGKGQSEWQAIDLEGGLHYRGYVEQGIHDLIDALKTGREPELASWKALKATELIFATYESSRR
ncbi:MAG: oxidoreductase, partial [Chloroflexi bacterium RBG_13_56_8]